MADYPISIDAVRNMLLRLKHCHSPEYIDLGISMALHKLEGFTPMDVATVVHGRWEYNIGSYSTPKCSCCGWHIPYSEDSVLDARNYCPECGAKMDAKDMDVPTKDGGATDGV